MRIKLVELIGWVLIGMCLQYFIQPVVETPQENHLQEQVNIHP